MEVFLKLIANLIYNVAENNANTTCAGPAFQIVEPEEISKLRK